MSLLIMLEGILQITPDDQPGEPAKAAHILCLMFPSKVNKHATTLAALARIEPKGKFADGTEIDRSAWSRERRFCELLFKDTGNLHR